MLNTILEQLATLAPANTASAILGLVAGVFGMFYGLRAREFTAYGFYGFTSKEPEKVAPKWYHRALVVSISTIALVASVRALIRNL